MSKSYDNTVEIFEPEKSVKKKIMKIVTDSTPVEDPKDPDKCNVFALLKLVASPEELADWDNQYRSGGMGYGHAKKRLAELVVEYFKPYRDKRAPNWRTTSGTSRQCSKKGPGTSQSRGGPDPGRGPTSRGAEGLSMGDRPVTTPRFTGSLKDERE